MTEETPTAFFAALDVAGAPRELVALGGRLDVETLLAAYRAGCFPWPASGRYEASLERDARRLLRRGHVPLAPGTDPAVALLPWVSPHPRPVLVPERVNTPRSVRRSIRRSSWETTMDRAFGAVLSACAARPETWITDGMAAAYSALHDAGVAHSLEVWSGDAVGGLYGVLTGRVFSGESMFHRVSGASKAAVVDLCQRFREAGVVLIDTQDESAHMAHLGQVLADREDYIDILHRFRDEPVALPGDRRPLLRVLDHYGTAGDAGGPGR